MHPGRGVIEANCRANRVAVGRVGAVGGPCDEENQHERLAQPDPAGLLDGYAGEVIADSSSVYAALARGAPWQLAHRWAHARRKSVEAQPHVPEAATLAVDRIYLFHQGRLHEEGSDGELMAKNGLHAKICRLQQAMQTKKAWRPGPRSHKASLP